MTKLRFEEESYRIRGAIFEVYREMGCGFLEAVYQECLGLAFGDAGIPFQAQPAMTLSYKARPLSQVFKPDFTCFDGIVVELKAVIDLTDIHRAQVHNYLRASGYGLGLLVNFGHHPGVQIERYVRGEEASSIQERNP